MGAGAGPLDDSQLGVGAILKVDVARQHVEQGEVCLDAGGYALTKHPKPVPISVRKMAI
ncbi:hypothetical protein [Methylobacterium sp. WL8]|uniref:hypothetical protein n=1 Tax=Methylobacterium sp. WL8 TaxID=2603899 RepID=UPI00164FF31C|nr:hypothetical protein [Methylobacterium sp. WL8]